VPFARSLTATAVVALAAAALAAPAVAAGQGTLAVRDSVGDVPGWAVVAAVANLVALAGLVAFALIVRGRRRRGDANLATWVSAESPTAAARAVSAAPAAAAADRPDRTTLGAMQLARLAADYLEVVGSGSRRPVVDLAERRSWDVERTRRALARARARGLLLSAGRGRVGGALSPRAQELLGASRPAIAEAHDQPQPGPGLVKRADRVVNQPGGHADLAHDVLGDVGRHPGRSFGPRHPEATVGSNGRARRG
jgi:hypothetical protein